MNEFEPHDYFKADDQGYISRKVFIEHVRNSYDHMRELSALIKGYDQTIDTYLERWDQNMESLDDDVIGLLHEWIDDSTFATIINEEIFKTKADKKELDKVNTQLAQKANQVENILQELPNKPNRTDTGWANLNTFDEPTRAVLQGLEPGQINAVLGYKNVHVENADFIEQSTNLFNKDDVIKNIVIRDTGVEDSSGNYDTSEFIRVYSDKNYIQLGIHYISYYDEGKNFISRQGFASIDVGNQLSLPINTYFIRASYHVFNSDPETIQINTGDTLLPYEPFKSPKLSPSIEVEVPDKSINGNKLADKAVNKQHLGFLEKSTNLFDKNNVEKNSISFDGEIKESSRYLSSDYITVDGQEHTSIYATYIAFYDSDKNFIKRVNPRVDGVDKAYTFQPDGATYVKLVIDTQTYTVDDVQLNKGSKLLPYEKFGEYIDPNLIKVQQTDESREHFVFDSNLNHTFSTNEVLESKTDVTLETDSADFYAMYDDLVTRHPDYVSRTLLGNEATGKPIYRYDFNPPIPNVVGSDVSPKPKVFIMTGTHYEKTGIFTLYNTMQQVCDNWQSDELLEALRFNVHFVIIPVLNPWGIDNIISRNSNHVNLNLNFPIDWEETDGSGEFPLSEIETQLVAEILEKEDVLCAIDFHNFFGTVGNPPDYFVWTLASNLRVKNVGDALARRLTRKWSKEYEFIPQDLSYFAGYTSDAGPGRFSKYANELGVKYPMIFEVGEQYWINPDGDKNDSTVMKLGFEAFTNLLLMVLHDSTIS